MPDQSGGHAILNKVFTEGVGLGGKTLTHAYPKDVKLKEQCLDLMVEKR